MGNVYIDELTGLYNEKYMSDYADDFILKNQNTRVIMIDLQRFKQINDIYGHEIGDECLKCFARVLNQIFNNKEVSIVSRLHGDEYCILTILTPEDINKKLNEVATRLQFIYLSRITPCKINFNAGDSKVVLSFDKSKTIADYMMYHAKKNDMIYQTYDKRIWTKKLEEDLFQTQLDSLINDNSLVYSTRELFTKQGEKSNISQIYTKNASGKSFLGEGNYSRIEGSILSQSLDMHNLNYFIENITKLRNKGIILFDHKSLLKYEDIISKTENLPEHQKKKIIIASDLRHIDRREVRTIRQAISELRKANIGFVLDKIDSSIPDNVFESLATDYFRFSPDFWKQSMSNPKKYAILKYKLKMLAEVAPETITLFDFIDNEEEHNYLSGLISENSLVSGNNYSKEKKLKFTR